MKNLLTLLLGLFKIFPYLFLVPMPVVTLTTGTEICCGPSRHDGSPTCHCDHAESGQQRDERADPISLRPPREWRRA